MSLQFIVFLAVSSLLLSAVYGQSVPNKQVLNCMVCKALVDEIEAAVDAVDPARKIEVGSFRLDGNGNLKPKKVPYANSQLHLSEVMDKVCEGFKEYVLAHYKSTGTPTLLRLTSHDGNMNPEMGNVDITPNPELNDKLSYYCQNLVEDHEDEIISVFAKKDKKPHDKICVETASVCSSSATEDDDHEDSEPYNFEHEDL